MGGENSSSGLRKKPRSDIDGCASPSSPCPSKNGCGTSRSSKSSPSELESGSKSSSDSADAPDEGDLYPVLWKDFLVSSKDYDNNDDATYFPASEVESEGSLEYEAERDEPSLSLSSEPRYFGGGGDEERSSLTLEPADIAPASSNDGSLPSHSPERPRFRSSLSPLGTLPWPEPSAAASQLAAGPSSHPIGGPLLRSQSDASQSSIEDFQPAGPSNPHQRPRGLARARERLRPTASGDVEAYVYDEGSDYEHRLEREAQTMAAWRRYNAPRSTYPFQQEFDVIRGAPNVPLVTFADDEEEEEEERETDSKGKGKQKA